MKAAMSQAKRMICSCCSLIARSPGQTIQALSLDRRYPGVSPPLRLNFLSRGGRRACELRSQIEFKGTQSLLCTWARKSVPEIFRPYHLDDLPRFADPNGKLYEVFGLTRAELRQYFNAKAFSAC